MKKLYLLLMIFSFSSVCNAEQCQTPGLDSILYNEMKMCSSDTGKYQIESVYKGLLYRGLKASMDIYVDTFRGNAPGSSCKQIQNEIGVVLGFSNKDVVDYAQNIVKNKFDSNIDFKFTDLKVSEAALKINKLNAVCAQVKSEIDKTVSNFLESRNISPTSNKGKKILGKYKTFLKKQANYFDDLSSKKININDPNELNKFTSVLESFDEGIDASFELSAIENKSPNYKFDDKEMMYKPNTTIGLSSKIHLADSALINLYSDKSFQFLLASDEFRKDSNFFDYDPFHHLMFPRSDHLAKCITNGSVFDSSKLSKNSQNYIADAYKLILNGTKEFAEIEKNTNVNDCKSMTKAIKKLMIEKPYLSKMFLDDVIENKELGPQLSKFMCETYLDAYKSEAFYNKLKTYTLTGSSIIGFIATLIPATTKFGLGITAANGVAGAALALEDFDRKTKEKNNKQAALLMQMEKNVDKRFVEELRNSIGWENFSELYFYSSVIMAYADIRNFINKGLIKPQDLIGATKSCPIK